MAAGAVTVPRFGDVPVSPRAEAVPRVLNPGRGEVEHGQVTEAAVQQCPGERGCAAAHVDDGVGGRDPGSAEHPSDMCGCSSNQLRVSWPWAQAASQCAAACAWSAIFLSCFLSCALRGPVS